MCKRMIKHFDKFKKIKSNATLYKIDPSLCDQKCFMPYKK